MHHLRLFHQIYIAWPDETSICGCYVSSIAQQAQHNDMHTKSIYLVSRMYCLECENIS
jgi:hypothetical protein